MSESNQKSFLRSVSNETKNHFDVGSKVGMFQNNKLEKDSRNRRKSKLVRSDNNQIESIDSNDDEGNFILEKFLTDAVSMKKPNASKTISNSDSKVFKKPVPLPRKTKTVLTITENSLENASNKTYSVNDFDLASTSSKATYNLEINDTKSESSGATYNIYKTRKINSENIPIGDILIHNSPTKLNVIDKKRSESSNSSKASFTHRNPTNWIEIKKNLVQTINEKQTIKTTSRNADSESTIITDNNSKQTRKYHKHVHSDSESTIINDNLAKQTRKYKPVNSDSESTVINDSIAKQSRKYHKPVNSDSESAITNDNVTKQSRKYKPANSDSESAIITDNLAKQTRKYYKPVNSDSESAIITDNVAKQTRKSTNHERVHSDSESSVTNEKLSKTEQIELKDLNKKRKSCKNDVIETDLIEQQEKVYNYVDFIGVEIYKTDKLLLNSLINRPCVKIHIVNSGTGEYLKKSKIIDENSSGIEFIEPLITKPYNLQEKRSLIPHWEELLIVLDDFNYLLDNSIVIFFELLDFLTFSAASSRYQKEGANSGWHKVAWAFLKPVGTNHLNTDKKLRLQLYKPKKYTAKKSPKDCLLFDWWAKGPHLKYPSTLHVNIKRVKSNSIPADPILTESIIDKESNNTNEKEVCETKIDVDQKQKNKWSRVTSQFCKIPNKVDGQLKTGKKGCMTLKFSNGGVFLGYGVAELHNYPIIIYNILDKNVHCKFSGHQALIYDLNWSKDDHYIVSASGDCTVYIWDVINKNVQPIQILPHPTFVYCARVNSKTNEIMTGCYDQILRIWKSDESDFQLVQELDGHTGYVTSMCFTSDESVFYSSDCSGLVIEWLYNNSEWHLQRLFKFKELANTVINNLILHSGGNRLIICCRDSVHRMVDLTVGCIIQWFRGVLNNRIQTTSCVTPCSNYLFAPSEDGTICIWNTDTGILQSTYIPYSTIAAPHCIQYHPHEHMIAISHHGANLPILLAIYDKSASGIELQLKNYTETHESSIKRIVGKDAKNIAKYVKRGSKSVSLEVIIEKLDDVLISARNKQ